MVGLEPFRTLPGSTARGTSGKPRLTNLMKPSLATTPKNLQYNTSRFQWPITLMVLWRGQVPAWPLPVCEFPVQALVACQYQLR
jgi:hypothetical protein